MTKDIMGLKHHGDQLKSHIEDLELDCPVKLWQLIETYAWSYACAEVKTLKEELLVNIKRVVELS